MFKFKDSSDHAIGMVDITTVSHAVGCNELTLYLLTHGDPVIFENVDNHVNFYEALSIEFRRRYNVSQ